MEEVTTTDDDFDLWLLIGKIEHAMLKARQKELEIYNVTPRQAYILSTIHDLGNKATLKEISNFVFREVHSISEQISRMEKKGLVKKIRDIPGKTLMRFEITEEGFELLDLIMKRESIHTTMSVLSEEERQALGLCLGKVLSKLQETV